MTKKPAVTAEYKHSDYSPQIIIRLPAGTLRPMMMGATWNLPQAISISWWGEDKDSRTHLLAIRAAIDEALAEFSPEEEEVAP